MKSKLKIIRAILFSKISHQPYKFNFAITSACNALCKTCNIGRAFRQNPQIIKDDLRIDEIDKIFQSLPQQYCLAQSFWGRTLFKERFGCHLSNSGEKNSVAFSN